MSHPAPGSVMRGRVLICAGSDSGGGAGLQADIKTVTALAGFAATAVTALTAQNTRGVFGIHEVPAEFLAQQMQVVLDDIGADCIKTGMLHSTLVIETVASALDRHAADVPLVMDPVMVAKGGHRLLDASALDALRQVLVPRARLVTPNIPEAEDLAGLSIGGVDDMRRAAGAILELGASAVLVKGGHLPGDDLVDLLATADGMRRFESRRIHTRHTHGTGCSLASAIAASLAQGLELEAAIMRARSYVEHAIRTAPGIGQGHGPLNHAHPVAVPR